MGRSKVPMPITHGRRSARVSRRAAASVLALAAGCAPGFRLRPPAAVPAGAQYEAGLGASAVSPRPLQRGVPWTSAAVGWTTVRTTERTSLSALGAWDGDQGAAGLSGELRLIEATAGAVAVSAEAGWLWTAADMSAAVALPGPVDARAYAVVGGRFWGLDLAVRTVGGLDVPIGPQASVRMEGGASWPELDPFKRRLHLALGVVVRR